MTDLEAAEKGRIGVEEKDGFRKGDSSRCVLSKKTIHRTKEDEQAEGNRQRRKMKTEEAVKAEEREKERESRRGG